MLQQVEGSRFQTEGSRGLMVTPPDPSSPQPLLSMEVFGDAVIITVVEPLPFDIVADALAGGDGCSVHPHCLTCPLARCIYDAPHASVTTQHRTAVEDEIVKLRDAGLSADEIAVRVDRTKRSVYRLLKQVKDRETRTRNSKSDRPAQ